VKILNELRKRTVEVIHRKTLYIINQQYQLNDTEGFEFLSNNLLSKASKQELRH